MTAREKANLISRRHVIDAATARPRPQLVLPSRWMFLDIRSK
jgi:hypothetical protein